MKIGCVILAGGKSSRMRKDKALLPLLEETFLARICREFSFFEEKIIARGDLEEPGIPGWESIKDVFPDHGPIGGIDSALYKTKSEAIFLTPCDMPLLRKELYYKLLSQMSDDDDAVIAVTESGRYQPLCAIYHTRVKGIVREELLAGKNKMMQLLGRMRVKTVILNEKEYGIQNINTLDEYDQLKKYF